MLVKKLVGVLLGIIAIFTVNQVYASIIIPMYLASHDGKGKNIGTVKAEDYNDKGVLFTPKLDNLTPGSHGFHIHENPSCLNNAMAAGSHLDPDKTNKHEGPYDKTGHSGDLPFLMVDKNGRATLPVLAPRLTLADIKGRTLMIHAGADNYSDKPEKNGGGGDRIACGVISGR